MASRVTRRSTCRSTCRALSASAASHTAACGGVQGCSRGWVQAGRTPERQGFDTPERQGFDARPSGGGSRALRASFGARRLRRAGCRSRKSPRTLRRRACRRTPRAPWTPSSSRPPSEICARCGSNRRAPTRHAPLCLKRPPPTAHHPRRSFGERYVDNRRFAILYAEALFTRFANEEP